MVDGLCQALDNMRRGIDVCILLISIFYLWSCSDTREVTPEDLGMNYYPLRTGLYNIYQVNGVEYVNANDSTVFSYQLKESVIDSFLNLESGISYKILRQKRDTSDETWETDSIWTVRKDEIRVIRTENNIPIINLVFPVSESKIWDANGLNDRDIDNYEMVEVGKPYNGEFVTFDETLTVIQEYIPDKFVNFISRKEIYSKQAGLVYKENIKLIFLQGDQANEEIIDSGIRYFQSIIEYGQE